MSKRGTILQNNRIIAENVPKVFEAGQKSMVDESKIIEATTTGESILLLDDVSEIPHEVDVRVWSKNLLDVANAPELYWLGYTWEKTDTGFIATSTTNADNCWIRHGFNLGRYEDLIGKTFTVSVNYNTTTTGEPLIMAINNNLMSGNGNSSITHLAKGIADKKGTLLTFTVPEGLPYEYVCVVFYFTNGKPIKIGDTVEYSNIQIEEGTEATPYVPYVDVSGATVDVYGGNILDIDAGLNESLVKNADGTYTFTRLENKRFSRQIPLTLTSAQTFLSCYAEIVDTNYEGMRVVFRCVNENGESAGTLALKQDGNPYSIKSCEYAEMFMDSTIPVGTYITFRNPQLAILKYNGDSLVTDYEPYVKNTLHIDEEGKATTKSISPYMTIIPSVSGAQVTADYHKSWGMQTEWDRFWGGVQQRGERRFYDKGFASPTWSNSNFKPKYDIRYTSCYELFADCNVTRSLTEILKEYNVSLIRERPEGSSNHGYMFKSARFSQIPVIDIRNVAGTGLTYTFSSSYIVTIDGLIVNENTTFTQNTFNGSDNLESLTIEGVLATNGLNLHWSTKLSHDSIVSIINALSTTTSGLTVTLSKTAVNTAFETSVGAGDGSTSSEWLNLIATRNNWTISLV